MSASITHASSQPIPDSETSHPDDPVPQEPLLYRAPAVVPTSPSQSLKSHDQSSSYSDSSDSSAPSTPSSELPGNDLIAELDKQRSSGRSPKKRRASTVLVSQNANDVARIFGEGPGVARVRTTCCGGGCCMLQPFPEQKTPFLEDPVSGPDNKAYRSLNLRLGPLELESELSGVVECPPQTVRFENVSPSSTDASTDTNKHPPSFVTPHPPYEVFSAPLFHARELTKPGAQKRTYHFDLDVTDYPEESGTVDFVVGGAIGICAPNSDEVVDQIFDQLGVARYARDRAVLLKTTTGRWPTIWGDEKPRELVTTRRELLKWCSDVQSYPPTKTLLRLLGEYAESRHEKKILFYLSSAQGQASFCDLRTGPYVTLYQLLSAFPSSRPPIEHLLSVLNTLMPRFYSLSQDPQISCLRDGTNCRRLVEIAVTIHDSSDWNKGTRTGVGSGFLERLAHQVVAAEAEGIEPKSLNLRVPMFRGLMTNPLAREFVSDGPMLLIGAGVGIAPFRGFVQRRLKSANCANKVWVLQGVRDSLVDELYSGEWGVEEEKVKKIVQSRRGKKRYVQEEVRHQADLVWFIINALDGRVFVCGSSKGMGEGVESSLVDVAMVKGNLNEEEARAFWLEKKKAGQYIAETW